LFGGGGDGGSRTSAAEAGGRASAGTTWPPYYAGNVCICKYAPDTPYIYIHTTRPGTRATAFEAAAREAAGPLFGQWHPRGAPGQTHSASGGPQPEYHATFWWSDQGLFQTRPSLAHHTNTAALLRRPFELLLLFSSCSLCLSPSLRLQVPILHPHMPAQPLAWSRWMPHAVHLLQSPPSPCVWSYSPSLTCPRFLLPAATATYLGFPLLTLSSPHEARHLRPLLPASG
jgi:hypothetical protein